MVRTSLASRGFRSSPEPRKRFSWRQARKAVRGSLGLRDLGFFKTTRSDDFKPVAADAEGNEDWSSSFEKFQELLLGQLGLSYYVHERGLVNLFVERYDCASTISMSQENMTAPLPYGSEACLNQGPNDFFSR